MEKLTDDNYKLKGMLKEGEKTIEALKRERDENSKALTVFQKELESKSHQLEEQMFLHIFEGRVLEENNYMKEFLKVSIEKYQKRNIVKTRILFKYDKKSNTNFHHYVDGYKNVVLIVRTASGMFVAGYSESSFNSKESASKGGMLLSLSNQKSYELLPKMRALTYDDYYLIFGNSELRIKSLENKVFSNFGMASGYYNRRGDSVDSFLGEGTSREVYLEDYELHEVIFK
jgi:hypothetical protein